MHNAGGGFLHGHVHYSNKSSTCNRREQPGAADRDRKRRIKSAAEITWLPLRHRCNLSSAQTLFISLHLHWCPLRVTVFFSQRDICFLFVYRVLEASSTPPPPPPNSFTVNPAGNLLLCCHDDFSWIPAETAERLTRTFCVDTCTPHPEKIQRNCAVQCMSESSFCLFNLTFYLPLPPLPFRWSGWPLANLKIKLPVTHNVCQMSRAVKPVGVVGHVAVLPPCLSVSGF